MILDNRQNGGGADTVARGTLAYFMRGVAGYFTDRQGHCRTFNIVGTDVNGSSRLPVVVLVGPNSASLGELTSGILRDMGEAYLIGERTEGNIELLRGYDFADGLRAWIAHEVFIPPWSTSTRRTLPIRPSCSCPAMSKPIRSPSSRPSVCISPSSTLTVSGSFSDADGDPLTLTASLAIGTFTDNRDGTWSGSLGARDDLAARPRGGGQRA